MFSVDLQTVVGTLLFPSVFCPGVGKTTLRGGPDQIAKCAVFILSPKHPNLCERVLILIKKYSHIPCQNFNKLCKMKIQNFEAIELEFLASVEGEMLNCS